MKSKTLFLLILVVVLPTALLSWGGLQLAQQQSVQFELQLKDLLRDQLTELDSRISRYFSVREASLAKNTSRTFSTIDSIRNFVDSESVIENVFMITPNGTLLYPNPLSPLTQREREFYTKIKTIVEDGDIQNQVMLAIPSSRYPATQNTNPGIPPAGVQAFQNQAQQLPLRGADLQKVENLDPGVFNQSSPLEPQQDPAGRVPSPPGILQQSLKNLQPEGKTEPYETCSGWYIWYWGRGVHLIYWQRVSNGTIIGIALERSRWISDLITELPDSVNTRSPDSTYGFKANLRSTKIINANAEAVYLWGGAVSEEMVLAAEIPVSHPLTAWKLQMWVMPSELKSQSMVGVNIVVGIIAFSMALVAVAAVFFREYTKEIKEAGRRVSFVNQVSHELRTPLTNIRMYAELLDQDLQAVSGLDAEKAQKRIQVVESESERLSRLIGNVLTFAGSQKNKLEIHAATGVIDDSVLQTLSSFTPNMEKLGMQVHTSLNAKNQVRFDSDALRQILGNLINNVEKYARGGTYVEIETRQENEITEISVRDDGPGIDPGYAEKIFEPFWRLSNELQHVSGTGIGLSISRELARIHGGNLVLDRSTRGARFIITLTTESAI